MGRGLKEYGAYHAWYNTFGWENSSRVHEKKVVKTYGNNSRCSSILVVCYFKVGAKMQNVDDGELESPICRPWS